MKVIIFLVFGTLSLASSSSCKSDMRKTIACYKEDSLRAKAASFIYDNIDGHYTIRSNAKDIIVDRICKSDSSIHTSTIEKWWNELHWKDQQKQIPDSIILTERQIVQNIEDAFRIWNEVPWKSEVTFDSFCQYVLPYRVLNENLSDDWRNVLYDEYKTFVNPDMTLRDAFLAIHEAVYNRIRKTKATDFPYLLNPLEFEKVNKGECLQCCLYECYVMRAMCIPTAIDGINQWANYSTNGHSWVSLLTHEGTYTIDRYSKKVSRNNPIDATVFKIDSLIEHTYPYKLNFTKKSSKIRRVTFEKVLSEYDDKDANKDTWNYFKRKHMRDVSSEYHLSCTISLKRHCNNRYTYLCTYKTSKGWVPVDYSKGTNGEYIFSNIGDSIIYLPMVFYDGILKPIEYPIKLVNGTSSFLCPDFTQKRTIVVKRKYPLVGHFPDIWSNMRGAIIEASNTPDFHNSEILHVVSYTPIFRNIVSVKKHYKKYRYIRLKMTKKGNVPLAEMEIYDNGKALKGNTFGTLSESLDRCCDGDYFTCMDNGKDGYTFGIDLGFSHYIDEIIYYLKNDGNFIIPNEEYELFYYDMGWVSCGRKTAKDFTISYNNIPMNALLLLRNVSQGTEERIFTYENDEQVWW